MGSPVGERFLVCRRVISPAAASGPLARQVNTSGRYHARFWLTSTLLGLIAVCLASRAVLAAPCTNLRDARLSGQFGDTLFREGDYFRAVTEYKRSLFLCPRWAARPAVELRIGRAYAAARRWDDALDQLHSLTVRYPESPESDAAALDICQVHIDRGDFAGAVSNAISIHGLV